VKVDDIISWNKLGSESLNVGQVLIINGTSAPTNTTGAAQASSSDDGLPFPRARKHLVQVGETLSAIATKRNVSEDSLRKWNKITSNTISIGQTLWYRTYLRTDAPATTREAYGKKVEEGIAMQIEDMESTDKYLALHKSLPIGTLVEIRNLMNNKKVYVRVVGQLPDTGVNQNVIVRLTSQSFKRLGILDARARVELTYYEE
jgi:LysM repeat protein